MDQASRQAIATAGYKLGAPYMPYHNNQTTGRWFSFILNFQGKNFHFFPVKNVGICRLYYVQNRQTSYFIFWHRGAMQTRIPRTDNQIEISGWTSWWKMKNKSNISVFGQWRHQSCPHLFLKHFSATVFPGFIWVSHMLLKYLRMLKGIQKQPFKTMLPLLLLLLHHEDHLSRRKKV